MGNQQPQFGITVQDRFPRGQGPAAGVEADKPAMADDPFPGIVVDHVEPVYVVVSEDVHADPDESFFVQTVQIGRIRRGIETDIRDRPDPGVPLGHRGDVCVVALGPAITFVADNKSLLDVIIRAQGRIE